MKAEIISVGTELLLGQIVDTNAAYLSRHLAALGIDVFFRTTVGDNSVRLREVLQTAYSRADLIITTGGLGPTDDDLTIETIADYWQEKLVTDEESLAKIRTFCEQRGMPLLKSNAKQAKRPENAKLVVNPLGTAPGIILVRDEKITVSLPGVPVEMYSMFEESVIPYLRSCLGSRSETIISRNLKFVGIGESLLEERVHTLLENQTNPTFAPYAKSTEVHLRVTAKAKNEKEALVLLDLGQKQVMERVGEYFYGTDEADLEDIVGTMLLAKNQTITTAESCSGGLISHRLTNVAGISAVFRRGLVTYSNEAKRELLGVSAASLEQYGAVSEQVALEMAQGARHLAGSDIGVAVTGIAGPGGGSPKKPVGLVYLAVSGSKGDWTKRCVFHGDREMIKARTAQTALMLIKKYLEK